jgi:hypothetical protein
MSSSPRRPSHRAPAPASPPTAYARWLRVARLVYIPVAVLVLIAAAGALALVLAGSRHASGGALTSAFGIIAAVTVLCLGLPLLLFVPARGGPLSRLLHLVGGLALVWTLGGATWLGWLTFGESTWAAWRTGRLLASISLERVSTTPVRVGDAVVGVRFETDFRLAHAIAPGRDASSVAEALRGAGLARDGGSAAGYPFSGSGSPAVLLRGGAPISAADGIPAGSLRMARVLWLAGLDQLPGDDEPCKDAASFAQPYIRAALEKTDASGWIVRAVVRGEGLTLITSPGRVVWEVKSAPFTLPIDARAWLAGYEALPVPTCEVRKAALDAVRANERQRQLIAGTLPKWDVERALMTGLCSGDLAALAPRAASDLPTPRVYEAAWRCADEARRPEILRLLGERIASREEDRVAHCDLLSMLHDGHDADRLMLLVRAGLPILCDGVRANLWASGVGRTARRLGTPDEIAREIAWIRVVGRTPGFQCSPAWDGLNPLQIAVLNKTVDVVAAWLDAGCDPAARPDPATSDQPNWSSHSARMMWMLRRHPSKLREWLPLSDDAALNAAVSRRMGGPDAAELNTPFARRGGRVPLHDFANDALWSPALLREMVDRGARLDAASHAPALPFLPMGPTESPAGSWFHPGYRSAGLDLDRILAPLTTQELRRLITPVDLTTGRPMPPLPQILDEQGSELGAVLCRRKVITTCERAA